MSQVPIRIYGSAHTVPCCEDGLHFLKLWVRIIPPFLWYLSDILVTGNEKSHREFGARGRALALASHFHVLYAVSAGSANLPTCPEGQKFARFLRCCASKRSHFAVVVEISGILFAV